MKQTVNIPQGESRLIGGQWYNQGEHEIDVPDAPEVQADAEPAPKPKKPKSSAETAAEAPQEISSESKE